MNNSPKKRRELLKMGIGSAVSISLLPLSGCIGGCGEIPELEPSSSGREMSISGKVFSKDRDGDRLSIEGSGGNFATALVAPGSQSYVRDSVETGDCVTVSGTVEVGEEGSITVINANL